MADVFMKFLILFIFVVHVRGFDDIDRAARVNSAMKLLRSMENQTSSDSLNLPANATSIRENITDTFSCENRTYGYYADVDNDCQIFHVCLPSQTPSGRNTTYRWSFICPNETIFNQEVLVCTRPRDSIDCEDSPMYYDVNMEIGKESNDTKEQNSDNNNNKEESTPVATNTQQTTKNKDVERIKIKNQKRKQTNVRKQNIIAQIPFDNLLVQDNNKEEFESEKKDSNIDLEMPTIAEVEVMPASAIIPEDSIESMMENSRLIGERRLNRRAKKMMRGLFRFKADV